MLTLALIALQGREDGNTTNTPQGCPDFDLPEEYTTKGKHYSWKDSWGKEVDELSCVAMPKQESDSLISDAKKFTIP